MSGWRQYAEGVLRGEGNGDNRDKGDKTPAGDRFVPIVPFVPLPPALNPQCALDQWCAGFNVLHPCQPLPGFTMGRWQTLYDAAIWFLETFAVQPARDGWSTADLFGIVPDHPGRGGLIDRIGESRSLVMSADTARWRSWGVPQSYRRGALPDLEPFWSASDA